MAAADVIVPFDQSGKLGDRGAQQRLGSRRITGQGALRAGAKCLALGPSAKSVLQPRGRIDDVRLHASDPIVVAGHLGTLGMRAAASEHAAGLGRHGQPEYRCTLHDVEGTAHASEN